MIFIELARRLPLRGRLLTCNTCYIYCTFPIRQISDNVPPSTHPSAHKSHERKGDDEKLMGKGLFFDNKEDDVAQLVDNYTAPSLAKALRDREETLQICALLAEKGDTAELMKVLSPFLKQNIERKRKRSKQILDLSSGFSKSGLTVIQRLLHRQPREVAQSTRRRASVMIPLCNVNGEAAVLFERRSGHVRRHKYQVCFPGGFVDELDSNIIDTSIREMQEEVGVSSADILGVLRCDWAEVSGITGNVIAEICYFEVISFSLSMNMQVWL
jgi:hypothetical protein